jgi:hypothetical protein
MAIVDANTGFSIEIEGFRLETRGTHDGLPLYECIGGIITAVAIVDDPAIGVKGRLDEKESIMYAPVMIPDLKIFRNSGINESENCYWYFSAENIKYLMSTFKGKIKLGH